MMVGKRPWFSRILLPLCTGLVYLFMYLPVVVLVVYSFNGGGHMGGWTGFSLKWYAKMLEAHEMLASLKTTMVVACYSTVLSVGTGLLVVVASRWWRQPFMFSVFYPSVVLPEIVMAVGLLSFYVVTGAPLGYCSMIAGHTVIGLGLAVPLILSRFQEIDPFLTEASMDLGATYFQTFYRILLPLLSPALLAAAFLVFTLSMDDFFFAFFCSGPSLETVSLHVFAQVRAEIDPSVNALSVCLLVGSVVLTYLLSRAKVMDKVVANG